MDSSYQASPDVHVLPSHLTIPGVGTLVVNSFVLLAQEPVLVDAGIVMDRDAFMESLRAIVDPAEIRWVWITHDDADHTGSLEAVMAAAPNATLATHALGALRISTWWPQALERVRAIVPGEAFDVGDRKLNTYRPPTFDNPTSIGFHDSKTGAYFAVDTFGAILPDAVQDLGDLPEEAVVGGMCAWVSFDSPWTGWVDRGRFDPLLDEVRSLAPSQILSAHLPAKGATPDQLLDVLGMSPDLDPFEPPNAEAFAQIVAALAPPGG
ncbi:MAG TPA: MBL fold metallo-hydrolase [Acidimicrobiia bacterium]|nr:MBL fold metallo-hydrolase [Acidimicrobiia bacterium]